MRYLKMMKFAVTAAVALSLLFLTACGDEPGTHDKTVRISISPMTKSVESGGSVELKVDAKNTAITWPEQGVIEGSFSISGNKAKYVPPVTAGTYKFKVAAEADASTTVTANITVVYADPKITIKYPTLDVKIGKTIQFTATTEIPFGQPQQQDLEWEVSGGTCGTIDENGLFSAARSGDCTVRASLRDYNNRKITESVVVKIKETTLDDIVGDLAEVRGGTFTMGCDPERRNDCPFAAVPEHSVTLNTFYIGKYEVTQFLWSQVMGINYNPSGNRANNLPVENVSWSELETFFERLNDKTGKTYRLPTEAEWEYAARGGNQSKGYLYSGSDTLDDVGWYVENSDGKTQPVGLKRANELGLYDMSGNVDEWVNGDSQSTADGSQPRMNRIVRGGNSVYDEGFATVFSRGGCTAGCDPNPRLGFRLATSSK
ncbi:MAG: SUMF1/EgtB/PvdO family nonheme iron enzyme [Acidobacteriota bacterium]|nr:SUMF1/EgtB/PvdO family nonheme iron enzyme [Acidobacteriota bacterium]